MTNAKAPETKAQASTPKTDAKSAENKVTSAKQNATARSTGGPVAGEEKMYTIPLQDSWKAKFKRRVPKSISVIKQYVSRHLKAEKVKIGNSLNQALWSMGTKWPPRQVQVKAIIHDGTGWVDLPAAEWTFLKVEEAKKSKLEEMKKKLTEAAKKEGVAEEHKTHDKQPEKTTEEKKEDKKEIQRVEKEILKEEKSQIKKEVQSEKKKKSPQVHVKEPENVK